MIIITKETVALESLGGANQFLSRLISGIVLVLAAIFVFVQGGYFLLFALGVLSLLGVYELLRVLQDGKNFPGSGVVCGDRGILWPALCLWRN